MRKLEVSSALSALGNRAYSVALVVLVFRDTGSPSWVAAAAIARYGGGLLAGLIWARWGDRWAPRATLVVSQVLSAVALGGLAAAAAGDAHPAVLVAVGALVRITACVQPTAVAALIPTLANGQDLADLAAKENLVEKFALLAGPGIGGLLLLVMSGAWELAMLAGCCLAAAVAALDTGGTEPPRPPGPTRAVSERRLPAAAWVFVAMSAMSGLVYGTDTVLLLLIGKQRLSLGDEGYGLLFASIGAGVLLTTRIVNRVAARDDLAGLAAIGLGVYCLPTALLVTIHNPAAAFALEAVRGAGMLTVEILTVTGIQRVVLPRDISRTVAASSALVLGGVAIGALVSPIMLHFLGLNDALYVCAFTLPGSLLLGVPILRRVDRSVRRRTEKLGPRVKVLTSVHFLTARSRPLLERLARSLEEFIAEPGTTLVRQGDPADAFYVLVDGTATALIDIGPSRTETVGTIMPGECFGEIGLLNAEPRTATVQAAEACLVYRISADVFLDAISQLAPSAQLLDIAATRRHATAGVLSSTRD